MLESAQLLALKTFTFKYVIGWVGCTVGAAVVGADVVGAAVVGDVVVAVAVQPVVLEKRPSSPSSKVQTGAVMFSVSLCIVTEHELLDHWVWSMVSPVH